MGRKFDMSEKPILFSAPMVRAILNGSKTQTRRAMNGFCPPSRPEYDSETGFAEWFYGDEVVAGLRCKYGKPGDTLWVKETFYAWGRWETRYSEKKGRDEWHFVDMTLESGRHYLYAADNANYSANLGANQGRGLYPSWWKRPAIFMPKVASRITLEITRVRVERLQDISEEDAKSEGIEPLAHHPGRWLSEHRTGFSFPSATSAFRDLWESINGPESWAGTPWVWVVEFKVVKP